MDLDQPPHPARLIARQIWRGLAAAVRLAVQLIAIFWSVARGPLIVVAQIAVALIVLFEEWGWRPLQDLLGRLQRFRIWAALERWVAQLPPYGALAAFSVPAAVLLPFKFLALYLLAGAHVFSAALVFITAKVAGTALVARIFILTKPQLMQIGWFATAYEKFVPWKDALFKKIRSSYTWRYGRMIKTRVRLEAIQTWRVWRPTVLRWQEAVRVRTASLVRDIKLRITGL